jgi:hypothetical protein
MKEKNIKSIAYIFYKNDSLRSEKNKYRYFLKRFECFSPLRYRQLE